MADEKKQTRSRVRHTKTIRPLRPSAGLEAWYRRELKKAVKEMSHSVEYWLRAVYRRREDEIIAEDASPAWNIWDDLKRTMKRWQKYFDELGEKLARRFVGRLSKAEKARFEQALKDAGWTVKFRTPRGVNNILQSAIIENVKLIKNLPEKYFMDVQSACSIAIQNGKDLEFLERELRKIEGINERRARTIARDQSNKITAALDREHASNLGITDAVWVYTYGSKEPRHTHVEMDGKRFKLSEGLYDPNPKVARKIQPAELINCRCMYRMLLPEMDYSGDFDANGKWADRRQSPDRPNFES
jgi:uncharacterized protein with gpF-like domain